MRGVGRTVRDWVIDFLTTRNGSIILAISGRRLGVMQFVSILVALSTWCRRRLIASAVDCLAAAWGDLVRSCDHLARAAWLRIVSSDVAPAGSDIWTRPGGTNFQSGQSSTWLAFRRVAREQWRHRWPDLGLALALRPPLALCALPDRSPAGGSLSAAAQHALHRSLRLASRFRWQRTAPSDFRQSQASQ